MQEMAGFPLERILAKPGDVLVLPCSSEVVGNDLALSGADAPLWCYAEGCLAQLPLCRQAFSRMLLGTSLAGQKFYFRANLQRLLGQTAVAFLQTRVSSHEDPVKDVILGGLSALGKLAAEPENRQRTFHVPRFDCGAWMDWTVNLRPEADYWLRGDNIIYWQG